MSWIVAHLQLILSVLAVLLAVGYLYAKGTLLAVLGQVWGLIVGMAKDVLAAIPDSDFDMWANMIYDVLPAVVKVFVSVALIKATLMKWRDLLVAAQPAAVRLATSATRSDYASIRTGINRAVEMYLEA